MSLIDSVRREVPLNLLTISLAAWVLFAVVMFGRVFIGNPISRSIVGELSGVSTVLIGKQGSYLQIEQAELDCTGDKENNRVNCSTQFEDEQLTLRLTRSTPGSWGEYSAKCQGTYAGSYITCWPLPSKSQQELPVFVDGQLSISDARWHELYQERGTLMPTYDFAGWVPLTSLLITLLFSMAIWVQMKRAYGSTFREQFLLAWGTRMITAAPVSIVIFIISFWNLMVVTYDAEDFIIKLWLNG